MSIRDRHAAKAGQGDYEVGPNDCFISVATAHGFFWETIWNHANNAELKRVRGNPTILLEGDRISIPELQSKEVEGGTEKRHIFRRKGVPVKVRFRFLVQGEPMANQPYQISFDGAAPENGQLDGDGVLEHPAPPRAQKAEVWLGSGSDKRHYDFELGELEPVSEGRGVIARLRNLGYLVSNEEDQEEILTGAIKRFQIDQGLEPTGEMDDNTGARLREIHGS